MRIRRRPHPARSAALKAVYVTAYLTGWAVTGAALGAVILTALQAI